MTIWYAQATGSWANANWNDSRDNTGNSGSPTSGDTADNNGYEIDVAGVVLMNAGITLVDYNGGKFVSSQMYAQNGNRPFADVSWNSRSDGLGMICDPTVPVYGGASLYFQSYGEIDISDVDLSVIPQVDYTKCWSSKAYAQASAGFEYAQWTSGPSYSYGESVLLSELSGNPASYDQVFYSNGHDIDCADYIFECAQHTLDVSGGGSFYSSYWYAQSDGLWYDIDWNAASQGNGSSVEVSEVGFTGPNDGSWCFHQDFEIGCYDNYNTNAYLSDVGSGHWLFGDPPIGTGMESCDGPGWFWVYNDYGERICMFLDDQYEPDFTGAAGVMHVKTLLRQSTRITTNIMVKTTRILVRSRLPQADHLHYDTILNVSPVQVKAACQRQSVILDVFSNLQVAKLKATFRQPARIEAGVGCKHNSVKLRARFPQSRYIGFNMGPRKQVFKSKASFQQAAGIVYGTVVLAPTIIAKARVVSRVYPGSKTIQAPVIRVRTKILRPYEARVYEPCSKLYIHCNTISSNIIYGTSGDVFKLNLASHSVKKGNRENTIHLARAKADIVTTTAYFHPESIVAYLAPGDWVYRHPGGYLLIFNLNEEDELLILDEDAVLAGTEYAIPITPNRPATFDFGTIAEA